MRRISVFRRKRKVPAALVDTLVTLKVGTPAENRTWPFNSRYFPGGNIARYPPWAEIMKNFLKKQTMTEIPANVQSIVTNYLF
jgi:hypothetical protein